MRSEDQSEYNEQRHTILFVDDEPEDKLPQLLLWLRGEFEVYPYPEDPSDQPTRTDGSIDGVDGSSDQLKLTIREGSSEQRESSHDGHSEVREYSLHFVVQRSFDKRRLLAAIDKLKPTAVLLDINIGKDEKPGLGVIWPLKWHYPDLYVIVQTKEGPEDVLSLIHI